MLRALRCWGVGRYSSEESEAIREWGGMRLSDGTETGTGEGPDVGVGDGGCTGSKDGGQFKILLDCWCASVQYRDPRVDKKMIEEDASDWDVGQCR